MKKITFSEKDIKRYKDYTKSDFPDEKIYKQKTKITNYKKKFIVLQPV